MDLSNQLTPQLISWKRIRARSQGNKPWVNLDKSQSFFFYILRVMRKTQSFPILLKGLYKMTIFFVKWYNKIWSQYYKRNLVLKKDKLRLTFLDGALSKLRL